MKSLMDGLLSFNTRWKTLPSISINKDGLIKFMKFQKLSISYTPIDFNRHPRNRQKQILKGGP